ncbi:MAG: N-glycosylase/DNA lyase [Candidatus Omnitrophica bacterium]|nr:N-glycosylase/DNA lyase [Candidatus Omnitrophota bacterium]
MISGISRKKHKIKTRLKNFKLIWNGSDRKIFAELCFCICTPQSKAVLCDEKIRKLVKTGVLFEGDLKELELGLKGVRFYKNKAKYILGSRVLFTKKGKIRIKDKIDPENISETRSWFRDRVKGIGSKEASHFLRNIGFGKDLAILDVHVLRNMVKYGIIEEVPGHMSKKTYLELEKKLAKFSKKIKIPMAELDLLFWSRETGRIFK